MQIPYGQKPEYDNPKITGTVEAVPTISQPEGIKSVTLHPINGIKFVSYSGVVFLANIFFCCDINMFMAYLLTVFPKCSFGIGADELVFMVSGF